MKRDFIELSSLSAAELDGLLRLGARLKAELKTGLEHPYLRGKTLAMIFQKPSLRTRLTFETGMAQLGGHAIYLAPQDIGYAGEPTRLEIGDHNEIREFVTINRGTVKGGGCTRVGDHNLIMAYTHIAHDCQIGSHIIMANAATLGGHVTVEDWANVGALCPVHHFVRIGTHSFIGGGTTITRDVLPFSKTSTERGTHAYGLNAVGLERRGFTKARIRKIHHAYRVLLASKLNTSQAIEKLKAESDLGKDVEMLIRFIEASERGVIK